MKRAVFAAELARRPAENGMSLADLAAGAHMHRGYLGNVEHGKRWPTETVARALDAALHAGGELLAIWAAADRVPHVRTTNGQPTELLELAARAQASDVSPTTLDLLDTSVDTMARAYTRLPPAELLHEVRTSARQISRLLDGRATLAQRRRLLVTAGWLALLAATLHVDLGQRGPAGAARDVAGSLGHETDRYEIGAWVCEIDTWAALVDQDWPRVATLATAGEAVAPIGSPAAAQLAMQAARAAARLGDGPGMRAALRRSATAADRQSHERPPDHHFYFDPSKAQLYTGTSLAWLGDPAAEDYARHAAARYETGDQPRRLATAHLDLGLVLARLGAPTKPRTAACSRSARTNSCPPTPGEPTNWSPPSANTGVCRKSRSYASWPHSAPGADTRAPRLVLTHVRPPGADPRAPRLVLTGGAHVCQLRRGLDRHKPRTPP